MKPSMRRAGRYEGWLCFLIATAFLPEELSIIIGDFRLPLVRVVLLVLLIPAMSRFSSRAVTVPSDLFAIGAGIWMLTAAMITTGAAEGAKTAGALALEFTGTYLVVRSLLEAPDGAVRLVRFCCKVMIVVVALALLDPLTGQLFTHDTAGRITGYVKYYDPTSEAIIRDGLFRAMGPVEHSILFGAVCAWFGILALCTFKFSGFSIPFAAFAFIGEFFSQSRGAQAGYILGVGLIIYNFVLPTFAARWKIVIGLIISYVIAVFMYSSYPISTLLQFGGLDPEAGWYRSGIWMAAGPMVLASPLFGVGLNEWDWRSFDFLAGPSIDTVWLECAMWFGIPGSLLLFLTNVSAFWLGPLDRSPYLSNDEQRLSVALGIVVGILIFLGFIVHYWGTCWILMAVFPAVRAHLAEAAIIRSCEAPRSEANLVDADGRQYSDGQRREGFIHQPLRLRIIVALQALPAGEGLDFSRLKKLTGATDGNLDAHIETLAKAHYVEVAKSFIGKRPQTRVTATTSGRSAFAAMSHRRARSFSAKRRGGE
jgi:DNA-binding MarR family transcriptional regulator